MSTERITESHDAIRRKIMDRLDNTADCPGCEGFGWRTRYTFDDCDATIDCPECGGSGVVTFGHELAGGGGDE